MIRAQGALSLTDFHRNTRAHLRRLKLSGRPEVLTINGKAELVVQTASAYQRLLDALERATNSARAARTSRPISEMAEPIQQRKKIAGKVKI